MPIVNDAPQTAKDHLQGYQGITQIYAAAQLFGNDWDPDGDQLAIAAVTSGTGGAAVLNSDGTISFTPAAGAHGYVPGFTYTVSDGHGGTATGEAEVFVDGPTNQAPVANHDTVEVYYGVLYAGQLLGNDSDPDGDALAISSVGDAAGGSVTWISDHIFFSFDEGYTGPVSFTYTVTDGFTTSGPATVTVSKQELGVVTPIPPIEHPTFPIEHPTFPVEHPTFPDVRPFLLKMSGTFGDDLIDRNHKVNGRATSSSAEDIHGHDGSDTIKAAGGNDKLRGQSGDDQLDGERGRDTLIGGAGKDSLTGGSNADAFVFDVRPGQSNADIITDFKHGTDRINLDAAIFAAIGTKLDKGEFYAHAGAHTAHDANDRIIYDKTSGNLYYDADGKHGHAAVQVATLSNHAALGFHDFAIV